MKGLNKGRTNSDIGFDVISTIIFVIAIIVSLYPFIWTTLNAFKTIKELFQNPLGLPQEITLSIYVRAWERAKFSSVFLNSLLVTVGCVSLVLATATPAGFALARLDFRGRTFFYRLFASSIIISATIIVIPLFYIVRNLGLYNNLVSVILTQSALALPVALILLTGFFKEIPKEIEESAKMDGCTNLRFLIGFVVPLSKPIITTVVIFESLWSWNEYLYPLTFLKKESVRTVPLQLQMFFSEFRTEWTLLFAALSIAVTPLLILYIILQKNFIKGLTAGAVKA